MAHVLMNPKAQSILHEHHMTQEVYIITRGSGQLIRGGDIIMVQAGDAIWIPLFVRHKLINTSAASLEHLVLAAPSFDSSDVYVDDAWQDPYLSSPVPFVQPDVEECFDGAKIIAYELKGVASVAFGWVINDPSRHKPAHYHKKTTEWIFVVEGGGYLECDGQCYNISPGDWIRVEPGEHHALRSRRDQHMVVVCICNPCFSMDDVHY